VTTSACSCPNCQTWPFVVIPLGIVSREAGLVSVPHGRRAAGAGSRGHDMQEASAGEKRLGLHDHGLHLIALAPMARRANVQGLSPLPSYILA